MLHLIPEPAAVGRLTRPCAGGVLPRLSRRRVVGRIRAAGACWRTRQSPPLTGSGNPECFRRVMLLNSAPASPKTRALTLAVNASRASAARLSQDRAVRSWNQVHQWHIPRPVAFDYILTTTA